MNTGDRRKYLVQGDDKFVEQIIVDQSKDNEIGIPEKGINHSP